MKKMNFEWLDYFLPLKKLGVINAKISFSAGEIKLSGFNLLY